MTIIKKDDLRGLDSEDSQNNPFSTFEGKTNDTVAQDMDTYFGDVLSRETSDEDENESDETPVEGNQADGDSSDDTPNESEQQEDDENGETSETSKDAVEENDENVDDIKSDKTTSKKSNRSVKRIKQLLEEKKQALAEVEEERKTRLEIERERDILRKKLAEVNVKSVEQQISSLKAQMVRAQDEGNTEEYVDLSTQLSELQGNKKAFETVQNEYKDLDENQQQEQQQKKQETQPKKISETRQELLQDWIETTPWFVTQQRIYEDDDFVPTEAHVRATQLAIDMEKTLIQEGQDPESEEFYETLTKRMNKLIKMYGVDNVLYPDVQSKNSKTSGVSSDNVTVNNIDEKTEDDGEDTTTINPSSKPRPKVSGSTRTSSTKSPNNGKTTMTLTPQQIKIAEDLGFEAVPYYQGKMVPLR